jgi:hypothetical protein
VVGDSIQDGHVHAPAARASAHEQSGREFAASIEAGLPAGGQKMGVPTYDNAETFVARLANAGVVALDPEITAVLRDESVTLSTRSIQRRFVHVTGMTYSGFRQIERARFAVNLLRQGAPIADVVWHCGYYDHAHLTHSLRQWIGLPPTTIADADTQLSFLYKTERFPVG